jgi:hypothetical protein
MLNELKNAENEGISVDVIENKWTKNVTFLPLSMFMKTNHLHPRIDPPLDIIENKLT